MMSRIALTFAAAALLFSGVASAATPTSFDELKAAAARNDPSAETTARAVPSRKATSYDELLKLNARASATTSVDMTPRLPTTTDQARGICNMAKPVQLAAR
ncbi:MAG: hypothetical protein QM767_02250 [Anaeromyxobacter sp.]